MPVKETLIKIRTSNKNRTYFKSNIKPMNICIITRPVEGRSCVSIVKCLAIVENE